LIASAAITSLIFIVLFLYVGSGGFCCIEKLSLVITSQKPVIKKPRWREV